MSALGEKRQREEDISQEDILAILESSASDAPTLDPIGVKHLLLSFEKAVTSNRVQRVKHASEPLKYLESEVNLDLAIKSLHGLSAAPELYSVFLASGSLPTALDLLAHDNLDIASGVVDMLAELMDGGDEDTHQGHRDLIDSLRESGLELLAHVAVRFNASFVVAGSSTIDADDASRDTDALTTLIEFFSTILSIVPSISDSLCGVSGSLSSSFSATSTLQLLLGVLFSRLRARDFDACKEAAGELLFSLAGSSKSCSEVMGGSFYEFPGRSEKVSGVENILESLALYRKRAPSGKAEVELVENIVNTLCTCILSPANRAHFLASEGCELLLRIIHEAGQARFGALKVLSFACTGCDTGVADLCSSLVRAGGLKCLFPAFMGMGLPHTRATHGAAAVGLEEEYCLSVIAALLWHLPRPDPQVGSCGEGKGMERLRLISKFSEGSGIKAQRLLELRVDYAGKLRKIEERFEGSRGGRKNSVRNEDGEEEEEEEEEESLIMEMKKAEALLKGGLFTLHRIDLICARLLTEETYLRELWGSSGERVVDRQVSKEECAILEKCASSSFALRSKFHEQGHSTLAVLDGLSSYAKGLEGSDGDFERASVEDLIKKLKVVTGLE